MEWRHEDILLEEGLQGLGLNLARTQQQKLLQYLELLAKWNTTFNLSAVRERPEMVTLHLLDSLSISPLIDGRRLIDVGTGGGLPGLPLAVAHPEKQWTLLDSAGKKTRFLHQVKTALELDNVHIEHSRAETFRPDALYDGVLTRAFAAIPLMIEQCRHLLADDGAFYAMKGREPHDELNEIGEQFKVEQLIRVQVPNLEAERCLIKLRRQMP